MLTGQRVKHYRDFYRVIKEWRHLIEEYCKEEPKDVPYFYTERALIGTLATAAWRAGGISLEEYSVLKGKPRGSGVEKWSGRADLWIKPRVRNVKYREYVLESKRIWQKISSKSKLDKLPKKCEGLLSKAKNDAKKVIESGKHLGLVFVIPYLPKREKKHVYERIKEFLKQLKKVDSDIAWTFPAPKFSFKGNVYPGVAMLIL